MIIYIDKNKNVCGIKEDSATYLFFLDLNIEDLQEVEVTTELDTSQLPYKKYVDNNFIDRDDDPYQPKSIQAEIVNTLNTMVLNVLPDGETLTPENVPSLVDIINPATTEESGTQANPIVIIDNDIAHNGYLYTYGKYYKWNNVVYQCKRTGESDGGTIKLFYTPDQLIGHYFVTV